MVLALRCVLYGSQKRQRSLLYTSLTDWFLKPWGKVFTARYALIPYTKQITFGLQKVKYDFHWADFHETHSCLLDICIKFPVTNFMKTDKWFRRWCQVMDGRTDGRGLHKALFFTSSGMPTSKRICLVATFRQWKYFCLNAKNSANWTNFSLSPESLTIRQETCS